MTYLELKIKLGELKERFDELNQAFDFDSLLEKYTLLNQETQTLDFWSDPKKAQGIIQEQNDISSRLEEYNLIKDLLETIELSYELALVDDSFDLSGVEKDIHKFIKKADELRVATLLDKPYDKFNAVLEFHPGAGGTESQDWAEMLYRMYLRYAEQKKYKISVLDYLDGEEAGLKSATILIEGAYAYGYLKAESGVHRLVRLSPFDSSGRRHTSFASVSVTPELDDSIHVDIDELDLKIDTYRSSGNGGQGVNTTDSAVRITHLPTKIVVTCQNQRSQIQNRETALKVLKGKLYQLELERKQKELDAFSTTNVQNAFGSQIRSYVFHPYSMVKDHRTNYETGNTDKVMNGDLDDFILAYLLMK
ncbi:MAG: peptide chain release factor 2 [Firmicutes bacterium]|nr:peptide chain release factor 2 [Bacillota bacterium]